MQSEYRNRSVLELFLNEIRAIELDFIKKLLDLAGKAIEVVFHSFYVLLSNICSLFVVFIFLFCLNLCFYCIMFYIHSFCLAVFMTK